MIDEETATFLLMQETKECEADAADEEFDAHLAAVLLVTGADVGRLLRNEWRNPT